MGPRERRLFSDLRHMEELAAGGRVSFRADGHPPDRYEVLLHGPGLARDAAGTLVLRNLHRCELFLHRDYPRRPPVATWLTPVFHPNLLSPERNGGVCLGAWSAAESLADLCVRLRGLVTWASINPGDPLDSSAAAWAIDRGVQPGADLARLLDDEQPAAVRIGPVTARRHDA